MPGETRRQKRCGRIPGLPQESTPKRRLTSRRAGWKHGRRASIAGLTAHYRISARQVRARARELAEESPALDVDALEALALIRLLSEALLKDILTRGVVVAVPIVKRGRTVGVEEASNPACEHLIALSKPFVAQFLERRRQARQAQQPLPDLDLTASMRSALAFASAPQTGRSCPDASRDPDPSEGRIAEPRISKP